MNLANVQTAVDKLKTKRDRLLLEVEQIESDIKELELLQSQMKRLSESAQSRISFVRREGQKNSVNGDKAAAIIEYMKSQTTPKTLEQVSGELGYGKYTVRRALLANIHIFEVGTRDPISINGTGRKTNTFLYKQDGVNVNGRTDADGRHAEGNLDTNPPRDRADQSGDVAPAVGRYG